MNICKILLVVFFFSCSPAEDKSKKKIKIDRGNYTLEQLSHEYSKGLLVQKTGIGGLYTEHFLFDSAFLSVGKGKEGVRVGANYGLIGLDGLKKIYNDPQIFKVMVTKLNLTESEFMLAKDSIYKTYNDRRQEFENYMECLDY